MGLLGHPQGQQRLADPGGDRGELLDRSALRCCLPGDHPVDEVFRCLGPILKYRGFRDPGPVGVIEHGSLLGVAQALKSGWNSVPGQARHLDSPARTTSMTRNLVRGGAPRRAHTEPSGRERHHRDEGRVTQRLLAGVALAGIAEVPLLVVMAAPMEAYPTVGGTALAALSIIELVRRRPA